MLLLLILTSFVKETSEVKSWIQIAFWWADGYSVGNTNENEDDYTPSCLKWNPLSNADMRHCRDNHTSHKTSEYKL